MTKVVSPKEREKEMEETRKKFFEESKFDPTYQRLGLFSFVGTTAISDDTYSRGKLPKRNDDGSVKTAPRNFLTSQGKRGKTSDCYFSTYEYIEDKYDPKKLNNSKSKTEQIKKLHETPWKPDGPIRTVYSIYPSMPTMNFRQIKRKLPDGSVYTEPRNFLTNPPKKGEANCTPGVLLGGYPEHQADPYNRKDQLAREQAKKDKAKMQEQPFKSMVYGEKPFFDDKATYGGENPKGRVKRPQTYGGIQHDRAFIPPNPMREGSTLAPFPEHMPEPYDPAIKKDNKETVPWKTTYKERTKPCVSVSGMVVNLRTEYPSLRHR